MFKILSVFFIGMTTAWAQSPYSSTTVLTKAKLFAPGVISTGDYESHPQFTPDGQTLYFLKCSPSFNSWTIVESHFKNGKWSVPEVAPFSGQYNDADPFITTDGKKLFFISNRPVEGKPKNDLDIWVMEKTETGWGEPRHLEAPVNSVANEWFPAVTNDGSIYFGSERSGGFGRCDIYKAKWENGNYTVENAGEAINTPFSEYEPLIAPDESYMIYESGKPGGFGSGDLYISYIQNGKWTPGINLGDWVNSDGYELGARLSPDGKYFFWMSTKETMSLPDQKQNYSQLIGRLHSPGNGLGDIYQIDFTELIQSVAKNQKETAMTNTEDQDRKTLSALNAQFIKNFVTNDTAAHNQIIHKDFVCIENSGKIVGREEYMNEWAHGFDPKVFTSFTYEDEFIRIFGNVALVRSKTVYTKIADGKTIQGNSVYTDTYVKENGRWWCVQAQITPVRQ